jgi:hypothetical protein
MSDAVDAIVDQWRRERPDVADELWAMSIVGRVQRLNRVLERELAAFFTQRGLQHWETDMLFTLRRAGNPLSAGSPTGSTGWRPGSWSSGSATPRTAARC